MRLPGFWLRIQGIPREIPWLRSQNPGKRIPREIFRRETAAAAKKVGAGGGIKWSFFAIQEFR